MPLRGLVALVLVGCSPARGRVDVVARPLVPNAYESFVVFADRDGESRTATLDAEGRASGEIEDGGSVWFVELGGAVTQVNTFTAYVDVSTGSTLEFGPPAPTPQATMTITGTPPVGDLVRLYSTCATQGPMSSELVFDDRCGATADILAVSYLRVNPNDQIASYAYLPGRMIMNGAIVAIAPGDWRSPERVMVNLVNAPALPSVSLRNQFGVDSTNDGTGEVLPLVGSGLLVTAQVRLDPLTPGQTIIFDLPVQASQDVDVNQALAPWVAYKQDSELTWSADDLGGALPAHATVIEYEWEQPIANYMELVRVRLLSPVREAGTLERPDVPDSLATYQPKSDFRVSSKVRLVRMEGGDDATLLRAVERVTRSSAASAVLGDLPGRSLAFTDFF